MDDNYSNPKLLADIDKDGFGTLGDPAYTRSPWRPVARQGTPVVYLGDAVSHQARSKHAHPLDLLRHETSALYLPDRFERQPITAEGSVAGGVLAGRPLAGLRRGRAFQGADRAEAAWQGGGGPAGPAPIRWSRRRRPRPLHATCAMGVR